MLRAPWLLLASSVTFILPFVSRSQYTTLSTSFCDSVSSSYYLRSNFKTVEIVSTSTIMGKLMQLVLLVCGFLMKTIGIMCVLVFKLEFPTLDIACGIYLLESKHNTQKCVRSCHAECFLMKETG